MTKKSPVKGFIFFILILAVINFAAYYLFSFSKNYLKGSGPLSDNIVVIIPEGSSLKAISAILAKNNIIKYPDLFTYFVIFTDKDAKLKAGEYEFEAGISVYNVLDKIESGDVVMHQITIAEGLMTSQILNLLKENELLTGDLPADIKEGSLLPETYSFTRGDKREKIVKAMQHAMLNVLNDLWENRADNLPIKTKEEALTLASIVEKETGISQERERVAGVFVNRLRKNMRLQTDPTVIYSITKGEYVLDRPLNRKDLAVDSKYNTYKYNGLPPGPIANPGKASIAAALNPAATDEIYFVADGTGGHVFAKTLKEHNANVKKWRIINKKNKEESSKSR